MKLTGIIEDVFRGVTIFRGYATLKTLAKLSFSTDYQRNYLEDRIDDIRYYMKESQFIFFPEIILGWQIEDIDAIRKIKEEESTSNISIEHGIRIKKAKFRFKSLVDGDEPKTKVVSIEIPNTINEPFFSRIDGNHRLAVVDKINQGTAEGDEELCHQIAPFCLIIQNKNNEAGKYEAAYFYLINSKAVPLTDEQNLKSIFSGDKFNDTEKKNLSIVNDIQKYEKIVKNVIAGDYSFVNDVFNSEAYTLSLKIFNNIDTKTTVESIKKALIQIEALYNSREIPIENKNIIISLLVAYATHDKLFFEHYKKWLEDNQLVKVEDVKPQELLLSFEELKKDINVFVAMPYFSEERVKSASASYKKVFKDINEKYGIPIHLIDNDGIMTYEGQTLDIVDNIMDKIKRCSIFVCDITDNNPNVTYEFGRAAALRKPIIILREEDSSEPKSDFSRFYYEKYDKTAHLTYEHAIEKHIIACLRKDFNYNSII